MKNGVECELGTQFGMAGLQFTMADVIWLNGRMFQFNMYPIDVDPVMELLNKDVYEHDKECDCGCGSK